MSSWRTTRGVGTWSCPECGYQCDSVTAAGGETRKPKTGDANICLSCGAPGIFEVGALGVTVRPPTAAERTELLTDLRVTEAIAAIIATREAVHERGERWAGE